METELERHRFECGDPDPIAYPSLLDPSSPSRTFETTGRHPYLLLHPVQLPQGAPRRSES